MCNFPYDVNLCIKMYFSVHVTSFSQPSNFSSFPSRGRHMYRYRAVLLRARFDENKDIKDMMVAQQLLDEGEKELFSLIHYQPRQCECPPTPTFLVLISHYHCHITYLKNHYLKCLLRVHPSCDLRLDVWRISRSHCFVFLSMFFICML